MFIVQRLSALQSFGETDLERKKRLLRQKRNQSSVRGSSSNDNLPQGPGVASQYQTLGLRFSREDLNYITWRLREINVCVLEKINVTT